MSTHIGSGGRVPAVLVAVFLFFPLIPSASAQDPAPAATVVEIRFQPQNQPLTQEQLTSLLPLKTGQPAEPALVRAAIQRLFETGEYADIAVDSAAIPGGVRLTFITVLNTFVGHVRIEGVPSPPTEGQLIVASQLPPGTQFANRDLRQAIENISDLARRNGFYEAGVESTTSLEPGTQETNIEFHVEHGKRAKFDGIVVDGDPGRPTENIVKNTGWRSLFGVFGWRGVTDSRVQAGVESVRRWYEKHDHLLSKVSLVRLEYHSTSNTVTPTLVVQRGPEVKVNVVGAKISSGTLREILPIYQERSVDQDLLTEGSRDLTSYLQARGYFDAHVNFTGTRIIDNAEIIHYDVEKGIRHKLVQIALTGNRYFSQDTLRERLVIARASFLGSRTGRFSLDYLARDVETIKDLYRANGFRDVVVTGSPLDNYQGKPGQLAAVISIQEGPQWVISSLDITGIEPAQRRQILGVISEAAGQPYSESSIARDRDALLDYLFNSGYPSATFEFSAVPDTETHRAAIEYHLVSGPKILVQRVIVDGVERTRQSLIDHRLSLRAGEPLLQDQLLEGQRRLYDLGIFSRVDAVVQNPEGDEPAKAVLYSVEEARPYSVNIGFGAEIARIGGSTTSFDAPAGNTGFSPRVSFGIDRLNFLGLGHTIGLQARVSTLQQRALFDYIVPQLGGSPNLSLQYTALFDISHDVRTFSARREEGSIQLSQRFTRATTLQYRFVYRNVGIIGTPLITPELIPLLSQPVRVGAAGFSIVQDRRDNALDSHHGSYNTFDFSLAAAPFGSQTSYGRFLGRNATYYSLTKNLVLARSTSFGTIDRFAGLPEIPLAERFFSGGSSSQRAFPDNQAGPRDTETGFPIGGNALLFNTVELRFPLFGDNVGGVLFNDVGNVYSDIGSISFRFRQRNLQDFNYGVQAFGFGIRYRTPIGPLRVDLSLSPNSPRFFGFQGTYEQLLYGGGTPVVQRINVFQFHLSLGQAF